jgi:hypothetical protein
MASRQEQKERRRQERIEQERAEAAAARRTRLVQIVAGLVVAAAIVIVVVVSSSGGGSSGHDANLSSAAKAAGCVLTNPRIEGHAHVLHKVKYKANPPTSGDHAPPGEQASDGDYSGIATPPPERYVHSLEHGRIIIQYRPGLPKQQIAQLHKLFAQSSKTDSGVKSVSGGFTLLLQNNTKMPYDVAATAWGHLLACRTFSDKDLDAIRAFRQRYVLQAPERVTQPE